MYLLGEGVEKDPETAANLMHFIEEEEKKAKHSFSVFNKHHHSIQFLNRVILAFS